MRTHNMAYFCKAGAGGIIQGRTMSLASIGALSCCLFLIGMAFWGILTTGRLAEAAGGRNRIAVYLEEDLDRRDIDAMKLELAAMDGVSDIFYHSKKDNLLLMCERLEEAPASLLYQPDEDNPFLASFTLRISDPEKFDTCYDQAIQMQGIVAIKGSVKTAEILMVVKKIFLYAGMGIMVVLMAAAALIVSNTIRITIFGRKKEISIMKYVGATDSFVRFPFFIEGILIGVISAFVAFGLLGAGYLWLMALFESGHCGGYLHEIALSAAGLDTATWLAILAGFIIIGMTIGSAGSALSARKYLKV